MLLWQLMGEQKSGFASGRQMISESYTFEDYLKDFDLCSEMNTESESEPETGWPT